MKKLLCFLGFHQWIYKEAQFEGQMSLDLDLPEVKAKRCCNTCSKKQILDHHSVNLYTGEKYWQWKDEE